jgi:hypothetical protein
VEWKWKGSNQPARELTIWLSHLMHVIIQLSKTSVKLLRTYNNSIIVIIFYLKECLMNAYDSSIKQWLCLIKKYDRIKNSWWWNKYVQSFSNWGLIWSQVALCMQWVNIKSKFTYTTAEFHIWI